MNNVTNKNFSTKDAKLQEITKKYRKDKADESPFKRVVIQEELVALTGDVKDAVILGQLIYWQSRTKETAQYIAEESARTKTDISGPFQFGWIYKASATLAEEVMLGLAEDAVRKRLMKMVEKGWLCERSNQQIRYDQKKQYRVNIVKINDDIKSLKNVQGENAGYYLHCSLVKSVLNYIPTQSGMHPDDARVVQPDVERNDVENIENINKTAKISKINTCTSSETKEALARYYKISGVKVQVTDVEYSSFKVTVLKEKKKEILASGEVNAAELKERIANKEFELDMLEDEVLDTCNKNRKEQAEKLKAFFFKSYEVYKNAGCKTLDETLASKIDNKFPLIHTSRYLETAMQEVKAARNAI